jgi:hypothetical protein
VNGQQDDHIVLGRNRGGGCFRHARRDGGRFA